MTETKPTCSECGHFLHACAEGYGYCHGCEKTRTYTETKPTSKGALRASNKVLDRLYPETAFDRHRPGTKPTALAIELAQIIHDETRQDAVQEVLDAGQG